MGRDFKLYFIINNNINRKNTACLFADIKTNIANGINKRKIANCKKTTADYTLFYIL